MFRKLKTLLDVKEAGAADNSHNTIIAPDRSMYAIGDVHGCDGQLTRLLDQIDADAQGDEPLVFLGDMIDRGPHSAKVLSTLFTLATQRADHVVVLMGNHERMMLDFIDDPSDTGARWLLFGGIDTLNSFGITGLTERPDAEDALEAAHALEAALPSGMLPWLRKLPFSWKNGNVCCVHAAMNPDKPVTEQSEKSLLWGHSQFFRQPRHDGVCVVHGHTIVAKPSIAAGRIAIDTGAYRGGRLSAVRLDPGAWRFLQA
ncbi:MAG: metallophosphoesterase family protein [Pseudomonadota bacterium]